MEKDKMEKETEAQSLKPRGREISTVHLADHPYELRSRRQWEAYLAVLPITEQRGEVLFSSCGGHMAHYV